MDSSSAYMKAQTFFRWMPTAIILWIFGVVFALAAVFCALAAMRGSIEVAMIGNVQQTTHWLWRGALANALVAGFCILSWYLMRRRLPNNLMLGAILVIGAAGIIAQRSIVYMLRGASIEYWIDMVLELPFLFYVVIYAYRECKCFQNERSQNQYR